MREYPLWATPQRQAVLVELALTHPLAYEIDLFTGNLVNPTIEELIDYWKADDREERSFLWTRERQRLHALRPQIRKRGPFDSIRREQYLADRPVFEIVAIGVSAFTFKRVAQVRIPELKTILWVDLTGLEISKRKFRKLARYQWGAAPKAMEPLIVERCRQAVQRFLNRAPRYYRGALLFCPKGATPLCPLSFKERGLCFFALGRLPWSSQPASPSQAGASRTPMTCS